MNEAVLEAGFALCRPFIAAGKIPGVCLGVVDVAGNRAVMFDGHAALSPAPEPLTREHWFDLASLTKVIATTPMILRLAEEGRIDLDGPLTQALPDLRQYDLFGAYERQMTFRDCLIHGTRLPAVEPLYTIGDDPARLRAYILQHAWNQVAEPVYSDINFILLGLAIERLTGASLSASLDAEGLAYGPISHPAVATEYCHWRGRTMQGEVHDENAYALGGEAGHAGLFGTVDGVLSFAQGLLNGSGASAAVLGEMRRHHAATGRTCGWEARADGWRGGDACSAQTIGHVGFTGTGLWVDFERGLAWTLLTNRLLGSPRTDLSIRQLRKDVGNAVIAGFDAER